MEINYSCCLISQSNSAWFPPTGAPPKPTGGAGHPHTACRDRTQTPQLPQLAECTVISKLTDVQKQGHIHTQGTPSTLDSRSNSCQKTASEDEITGSATKWGFPTGTLHKPATEQVAVGDLLSYKYSKQPM